MNNLSRYTHIIEDNGNHYLCNVAVGSVISVNKQLCGLLDTYKDNIECVKDIHPDFFNALLSTGMIVDENLNEVEERIKLMKISDDAPTSFGLIINPTLDCNLRCWYCYETHGRGTIMNDEVLDSVKRFILNKVSDSVIKHFHLSFFGGEPLLQWRRVVIPLISYTAGVCKANSVTLAVSFTTNGVLLTEDKYDELSALGINDTSFQISIDGNRTIHDNSRVGISRLPTFDTIMSNVVTGASKGFGIRLRFNYTPSTLDSFVDVLSFLETLPAEVRINIHCGFHQVWQTVNSDKEIKDKANRLAALYVKNGINASTDNTFTRYVCYADRPSSCIINYDGDVYKCTAREFDPMIREGVLKSGGDIEWNNRYSRRLTCRYSNQVCNECNIMPICNGGCSQHKIERDNITGCPEGMDCAAKNNYLVGWLKTMLYKTQTNNHI